MKVTIKRSFEKQEKARCQEMEFRRHFHYQELDMLKEVFASSGKIYIQKLGYAKKLKVRVA